MLICIDLKFFSSCFSVIHSDLAHSHFFGLNHISKHFPELPFSCKDGDKIQKCQTEMFSPLILVLSSSLSTGTTIPFLPFPAAVLCKRGCNWSERKSLQPSHHSPVHPHQPHSLQHPDHTAHGAHRLRSEQYVPPLDTMHQSWGLIK